MPDDQLVMIRQNCTCESKILKQPLYNVQVGIGLLPNHFLYDLTEDVIQRFIPMGIIQFLYESHMWSLFHSEIKTNIAGPKVLSVEDIAFGLHIWVAMCCISLIGFLIEKLVHKFMRFFMANFAYFSVSMIFRKPLLVF